MTEKTRFVDRMKEEMREWEARLDHLKVEAALGKMEARDELESVKQKLRTSVKQLRTDLKELSVETGDAWDDLAEGFTEAWVDVKSAIKDAASHYRS